MDTSLKDKIDEILAKSSYLCSGLILMCPKYPKEKSFDGFDRFVLLFSRCLKRYCYFLELLFNSIENEVKKILNKSSNPEKEFSTMIADDIFFIFDAQLFSCKGIFEKNVFFKENNISPDLNEHLKEISKEYMVHLYDKFLRVTRNEVTHLNLWGSGIGSMLHFSKTLKGFQYKIPTNFMDDKRNILCITDIAKAIFHISEPLVLRIFDIIATEIIRRYGEPTGTTAMNFGNVIITLEDFNLL